MHRAISRLAIVALPFVGWLVQPSLASAGVGDSPLPQFADNTPSQVILSVAGVVNRAGSATVFLCTSTDSSPVHIGVEVFDEAGGLQNDVHAGAGAVLGVASGATATIATSATAAFLEHSVLSLPPAYSQGSARVVASSPDVSCNVVVAEDGVTPPVSLSTLHPATQLAPGTTLPTHPLPSFGNGSPATASALFAGAVHRGTFETTVLCTSVAATNVDIGVELFANDGTLGNDVSTGNGAVLGVLPGQAVTFGTTGTAALLETSVIALPPIAQGVARVVSTSADVLCSATSLDDSVAPPAAATDLVGFAAGGVTSTGMLARSLPVFGDQSPSVAVATVPGVVKRGTLQTAFLCTSRASSPIHVGVQVFDRLGVLQNDVTADVGVVRNVAPGATVTIATSATAAYLEDAIIPLNDGLQGVARVIASSDEVTCSTVVLDDTVSPPASAATLGTPVRLYTGTLPPGEPLPTFSDGKTASHAAIFPGTTKRSDVETEILCTSIASQPIDIGVQMFLPSGALANDVASGNGALLSVAPGETVFFGTTGSAAFFENQVVVLPGLAQGMTRVVSTSGDVLCSGLVFDQAVSPPASMTALQGDAGRCGDGTLQPGEQCEIGQDGACPGNCDTDCLCPPSCGDGFLQAGEGCDDGNAAGGDCCSASCQLECDDGSPCTEDSCSAGVCAFESTLLSGCREAGKSTLQMKVGTSPAKNQMKWKWLSGPLVPFGDLGFPNSSSAHTICVFDTTGGAPSLEASLVLPPSPLWVPRFPTRWSYKDRDGLADGVTGIKIQAAAAGRSKMGMKAAGAALPMATPFSPSQFFQQLPSVIVQMRNEETMACWQSTFTTFTSNDGVQFKAKAP